MLTPAAAVMEDNRLIYCRVLIYSLSWQPSIPSAKLQLFLYSLTFGIITAEYYEYIV